MERTQRFGTTFERVFRSARWLLAALVLLAAGDAVLAVVKSGRYVLDVLLASLLWPLGLMMVTRRWPPLFRIFRVFFGVLAVYSLIAVVLGLLGYGDLVEALYLWPTTSPIHLLPGALQSVAVLVAGWTKTRLQQAQRSEG